MSRYEMSDKESIFLYIKTKCYGYKEEGIKLSSGLVSKHYFDLRKLLLQPSMNSVVSNLIHQKIVNLDKLYDAKANCVSGLTMGADPLIYGICMGSYFRSQQPLNPLIVRKEAKSHGNKNLVEGIIPENPTCVVVDDVVTTGASTIKAIDALEEMGIKILAAYCVLNREEGGNEALGKRGYHLYSLFKKSDFGVGE